MPIGLASEFEQVVVMPGLQIGISWKQMILSCQFVGKKRSSLSAKNRPLGAGALCLEFEESNEKLDEILDYLR
tara:strand:- start:235 stop:453 length:219 start_codon:yes stop_codon:yes gene_type:complete